MKSDIRSMIAAAALSASCVLLVGAGAAEEPRYDGVGITAAMHSGHFVATWEGFSPQVKEKLAEREQRVQERSAQGERRRQNRQ